MAHKQHRPPFLRYIAHLAQTLLLKLSITDSQHFIHYQDVRFQVGGDGKAQADRQHDRQHGLQNDFRRSERFGLHG